MAEMAKRAAGADNKLIKTDYERDLCLPFVRALSSPLTSRTPNMVECQCVSCSRPYQVMLSAKVAAVPSILRTDARGRIITDCPACTGGSADGMTARMTPAIALWFWSHLRPDGCMFRVVDTDAFTDDVKFSMKEISAMVAKAASHDRLLDQMASSLGPRKM